MGVLRGDVGGSSRKVIRKPDTFVEESHLEKIHGGAGSTRFGEFGGAQ
jgi:hypothetical protein